MTHLERDQLVLHYYGEPDSGVAEHLADCEECRGEYQRLQRVRCVAQALMGPVQLLALLLRQLRRLAANLHVTPLMRRRPS